jgi:hypothetical protein
MNKIMFLLQTKKGIKKIDCSNVEVWDIAGKYKCLFTLKDYDYELIFDKNNKVISITPHYTDCIYFMNTPPYLQDIVKKWENNARRIYGNVVKYKVFV